MVPHAGNERSEKGQKMSTVHFQIDRSNLRRSRFVTEEIGAVESGMVRFAVERFALTANNITYGVAGDMIGYWNFFPAEGTWGRIPVWGVGRVIESEAEGVESGERFFGYFPMSQTLDVRAGGFTGSGFVDIAEHRAALPHIYNRYERLPEGGQADDEAWMMLLRVLFMTGWLIDDFLGDNAFFDSDAVVILSASSKTGFSLAHCLSARGQSRPRVIGLTSPGNRQFTSGLGCYDEVLTYDEIGKLDASIPTTVVDMAGDGAVGTELHRHLADALKYQCQVGLTHWEGEAGEEDLPGAVPEFFFAPTQVEKRLAEWGPATLASRQEEAWQSFLVPCRTWLQLFEASGEGALEKAYLEMLEGHTDPSTGVILSLSSTG